MVCSVRVTSQECHGVAIRRPFDCLFNNLFKLVHHNAFIMNAMSSQITDVSIVCSTVGSGADQRNHQRFGVTGLCVTGEFPPQKASNTENIPFDEVIMFNDKFKYSRYWPFICGSHRSPLEFPHNAAAIRKSFSCYGASLCGVQAYKRIIFSEANKQNVNNVTIK